MNRVAQHPVQAFAAALAAVGVLSIMDAVMKALVLAIGIFAVSVWRSLANLVLASRPLSAAPAGLAEPADAADPCRARHRGDGDGRSVLLGHRAGPAGAGASR